MKDVEEVFCQCCCCSGFVQVVVASVVVAPCVEDFNVAVDDYFLRLRFRLVL